MRAAAAAPATEAVRQRGIAKCHYNWALSGVSSSINPATRTHAVWNIWQNFVKKENSAKACRHLQVLAGTYVLHADTLRFRSGAKLLRRAALHPHTTQITGKVGRSQLKRCIISRNVQAPGNQNRP